jgi:hypothetical protein
MVQRGVWLLEFEHSTGWVPFEICNGTSVDAQRRLRRWRRDHPGFGYRATRYIPAPAKSPKKRTQHTRSESGPSTTAKCFEHIAGKVKSPKKRRVR